HWQYNRLREVTRLISPLTHRQLTVGGSQYDESDSDLIIGSVRAAHTIAADSACFGAMPLPAGRRRVGLAGANHGERHITRHRQGPEWRSGIGRIGNSEERPHTIRAKSQNQQRWKLHFYRS